MIIKYNDHSIHGSNTKNIKPVETAFFNDPFPYPTNDRKVAKPTYKSSKMPKKKKRVGSKKE